MRKRSEESFSSSSSSSSSDGSKKRRSRPGSRSRSCRCAQRPARPTPPPPASRPLARAAAQRGRAQARSQTPCAACGSDTSSRGSGRFPGGGTVCRRNASCWSCSSTSMALAFSGRCALWCRLSARAIATVSRSCFSHERSRRSRRRRAALSRAANGCPQAIFTCKIHKKKTRALLVEMAGGGGGAVV